MLSKARMVVLKTFTLTEICEEDDPDAMRITLPDEAGGPLYCKPVDRRFSGPRQLPTYSYNRLPVVLNGDNSLWDEASLYILNRVMNETVGNVSSYHSIAGDLAHFKRWLEHEEIDFRDFPLRRLHRPTYRYHGAMNILIRAGEISPKSAKRRMGSVINFYRWVIAEALVTPAHPPWVEKSSHVNFKDTQGFAHTKEVITTDLQIKVVEAKDPYDGYIEDGGKLTPLDHDEQNALVDSLKELGNVEMRLAHYVALFTGARIQTVLTMRVEHMRQDLPDDVAEVRVLVGPGTGADTKNDKRMILFFPRWLYEQLHVYSYSNEAVKRRKRAGLDNDQQFLFLSRQGNPLYQPKEDLRAFDPANTQTTVKKGQAVRNFIDRRVIPLSREKLGRPKFTYKFHDLRATFGMNQVENQMRLVEKGEITLHQAREFVKARMAHESHATTDLYLGYQQQLAQVREAQLEYEGHLQDLTAKAMSGEI